ncbi:fasciclin-like arabinogalactan protein 1 [Triticum dicoccoides]|uniref:fasciclin-like arabinogalactan protein 1 n=1 Tax=Triticum dicoccoides TaxID=85692 RepID=UPI001890D259|nr:fasciclin-like arabinogalactan protein 1 [Triticum dicoccoides]
MASTGAVPCSVLLLLLLCAFPLCQGQAGRHNITEILAAASPDFTQFSAALAGANLSAEIDARSPVTVLAVDNAAVARLAERRLQPDALARVLSLHVLLDYLGDARLRTLDGGFRQAASLYQAHGAPGAAGIVNITRGGKDDHVSFRPAEGVNGTAAVFYVKSVKEAPWDIAVLQVSDAISSFTAEAKVPTPPAPAPAPAPKAPAPAPAPLAPVVAPAPAKAPAALPPSPKNHTAPPPKPAKEPVPSPTPVVETPAEEPGADGDQPPADEHKSGASDSEPWSLGAVVAVAVPVVVFLLW